MDKITKLSQDHSEVFEALTLFKESLTKFSGGKLLDYLKEMNKFFEGDIAEHFKFEEDKIFPSIVKV